eukprot:TRINITY_DN1227_c0_g1_i2.p1 TRINITY_DN1227_c0_g1~~TRINITY_DN1227_c0_g1_i2.p1  ORF type:complete len:632 (+),score=319.93 TRINITY_DN1227_c0_g1_i2:697-2592(+)
MDLRNDSDSTNSQDVELKELNQNKTTNTYERNRDMSKWASAFPPPKHQVLLEWKDINYEITETKGFLPWKRTTTKRSLLKGISGFAQPGQILVILGPSGAGKTTLLNILAGRLAGSKYTGEILVNGERRRRGFRRKTAFVLQEDLFLGELTVSQTLHFTSQITLSSKLTRQQKAVRAEEMIDMFKLRKSANTAIGTVLRRGISGGEKKRLNVANELIAGLPLLLLDEPTTGLDASTALDLIIMLQRVAQSGRTVITTLHQPSSAMFDKFDQMLILSDGRIAYMGSPKQMAAHFSSLGYIQPKNYNAADFALELVDEDPTKETKEEAIQTRENVINTWTTKGAPEPSINKPPPIPQKIRKKWPTGWFHQSYELAKRAAVQHVPTLIANIVGLSILGVILSLAWWQRGYEQEDIADRVGLIFFILIQWSLFPAFNVINSFIPERAVLKKERGSGKYRLSAYMTSKVLIEFIMDCWLPLVFAAVVYWCANLNPGFDRFVLFVVISYVAYFSGESIGLCLASIFSKVEHASVPTIVFFFIAIIVPGFYVSEIPDWFEALKYATNFFYCYNGLVVNEFEGTKFKADDGSTITGDDIIELYRISIVQIWINILAALAIGAGLRFFAYFILRFTTRLR